MRHDRDRCPTCGQLRSAGKKIELPVLCDRMFELLKKQRDEAEKENAALKAELNVRAPKKSAYTQTELILSTDRSKM